MRPYTLYKHINNTDVALMPIKIYFIPENQVYKLKIKWFNIVNKDNIFDLGCNEKVEIKQEDMKNWHEVSYG